MQPIQDSKRDSIIKIAAGVIVLGIAGFAFSKVDNTPEVQPIVNRNDLSANDSGQAMEDTKETTYRNGTYSATGMYASPAGQEEVVITLVIENDRVASAEFVGRATNPGSIKNQTLFDAGFDQYVIGKEIDSIKLEVVNGSSLTPKGFIDALVKIKAEAQA